MKNRILLKDKVIVITGGTKGVGRAVAASAAGEGARVVIAGRSEKDGKEITETINDTYGDSFGKTGAAFFVKADITQTSNCRKIIETGEARFGKITGLVNYAGILPACPLIDMEEEMFDQVFNLNMKGAFFCCKYALQAMIRAGEGSIVNIGSIHAYGGEYDRAAYACSKGALLTLTKHIAKNYADKHIRSNWVSMGWVATPGEMALRESQGHDLNWLRDIAAESIPLGRLLTEEDHVMGIMYLLSNYSSMVTGTELQNAGGFMP